ncbi:MAG: AAA family ATPase [Bacteroidaceae bacterium]|nr:AAA family ATPase [Bacteroidaceae bacterium]
MMEQTKYLQDAINQAILQAKSDRVEFVCPEHLLVGLMLQEPFKHSLFYESGADEKVFTESLYAYLAHMERVPQGIRYELMLSSQMNRMMSTALEYAIGAEAAHLDVPHVVNAMLYLEDSMAHDLIEKTIQCSKGELISSLTDAYEWEADMDEMFESEETGQEPWRQFVTCMNDHLAERNPLIGRQDELERTIQVLCRREKNNPLHVGESGVGKTAIVWGLAALLESRKVPERLRGFHIYELDLGSLIAGAQFRGDFEKRLKAIMEGIQKEGNAIVYIDEIHNLVGAGQSGEGAMDASQMLRPYMEDGNIRFIGSTTYQEMNRYMNKQRGLMRRFQQIDILEPSKEETVKILEGLQKKYEQYHHVEYEEGVMEYAVEMSAKYISDRYLPDKAIDLIDEAGAMAELKNKRKRISKPSAIGKKEISDVLTKICKINAEALKSDDNSKLQNLTKRMMKQIYGQDEAIRQVVTSVEMSKAGLLDEDKPLASLLFVGPTGVGKTEVAKVLAKELGIELVRFDMSEYTEKHTVAKLIGSPAGYVGYEDGGLLTDAIRKNPNCVLLLDEIEKAHSDIYNILLQVMDYARLTDNRGNKADFKNVIVIMTSNAGAQFAGQASIGFGKGMSAGEAMLQQVKKTFKPEFINRLSGTVVFNDMDRTMAKLILDKKLNQLKAKLKVKNVQMKLKPRAFDFLLEKGFTRQYGAREMDRIIRKLLSPLLMNEILYGSLKEGGTAIINLKDNILVLN